MEFMGKKKILHTDPNGFYTVIEYTDGDGHKVAAIIYPHGQFCDIRINDDFLKMFAISSLKEAVYLAGGSSEEVRNAGELFKWIRLYADGTFTSSPLNVFGIELLGVSNIKKL